MNRKQFTRLAVSSMTILSFLADLWVGSTVPVGTPVEFKGIDLLHVDLNTRLIFNGTSSADWVVLARQLGETVNI